MSLRATKADTIRAEHAKLDHALCAALDALQDATPIPAPGKLTAFVKRDARGRRIHEGAEPRPTLDLTRVRAILGAVNLDYHLPVGDQAPDDVAGYHPRATPSGLRQGRP